MPNPSGKNGYGVKNYPNDEEFSKILHDYAKMPMTKNDICLDLAKRGIIIGKKKLTAFEKKFGVPSVRKPLPKEVARQIIVDEVGKDTLGNNGPNYHKRVLANEGILLSRDTIRKVMHEECDEGFTNRMPGSRNQITRKPLTALGPNHQISADGHEKLNAQALDMGGVGLSIYGFRDMWTGYMHKLQVLPNSRDGATIGHVYLDLAEELGGIPLQLNTDRGSETSWIYPIQKALREAFTEGVDPEHFPEYLFLKSVHNIIIESFWSWLHKKTGKNMRLHLLRGLELQIFHQQNKVHRKLFYWMFPPLVQAQLDKFRGYWNTRLVTKQDNKLMPSSHIPKLLMESPDQAGGIDCLVPVPSSAIQTLRDYVTENVGPREDYFRWVDIDFQALANLVHAELGLPKLTFENSWDIFRVMAPRLEQFETAYL